MEFQPQKPNTVERRTDIFPKLEKNISDLSGELDLIDEKRLSKEQKSNLSKIKDRIFNLTKKTFRTVEWVTLVIAILGIANYKRTHSDLEIIKNKDNTSIYKHQDSKTTHYLNILSGRENFTEQDLRVDYDNLVKFAAKKMDIIFDKEITQMSIDELDKAMCEILKKSGVEVNPGELSKEFNDKLEMVNKFNAYDYTQNKYAYELVWTMEQECGNPKIRFISEDLGSMRTDEFEGAKHEDIINNTIYINPSNLRHDLAEGFFDEMSHMKQNYDDPIGSTLHALYDIVGVVKRSGLNSEKISEEYFKLYGKVGTYEHEAHGIIEPYLVNKYKIFIRNESSPKDLLNYKY